MAKCDSMKVTAVLQENSYIILKQMKVGCSVSKNHVTYVSVLRNSKLILQNAVHKCSLKSKTDIDKHGKHFFHRCFPYMLFTELR